MGSVFSGNTLITNVACQHLTPEKIVSRTVRTKGQYRMQRFFYILGGEAKYELTDKTILCKQGDILYLPPDATYVCTWEAESRSNSAVLVQFDLICDGEKLLLADEMFRICRDRQGKYRELFLQLVTCYTEGRFGYKLKCQAIALELLHSILTETSPSPHPREDKVRRAIRYVEDHYQEPIDVDALAQSCALCPAAFRSKFHAATGMSPIEYKNHLAMVQASELLRTGLYTVSEVARAVGIEDLSYFSRLFKRAFGAPPGKFKNSLYGSHNTGRR